MKILINRKSVRSRPWGGGAQFINNFVDIATQAGHQVIHNLEENIDAFLIFNAHNNFEDVTIEQALLYKIDNPKIKIVMRINDCDKRKATNYVDEMYKEYSFFADCCIFVSEWMAGQFINHNWKCNENRMIYNGVDKTIFKLNKKLDNRKINIVCHHWSPNENKNLGLNEFLDNFVAKHTDFTYTYIGRTQSNLRHSKIIEPLCGQALGDELGRYDVYVNNSYADPGPNSLLEAISCGLPTYANIVGGGAAEFVDSKHVFKSFTELENILLNKNFIKNSFIVDSWETCIFTYLELLEELAAS